MSSVELRAPSRLAVGAHARRSTEIGAASLGLGVACVLAAARGPETIPGLGAVFLAVGILVGARARPAIALVVLIVGGSFEGFIEDSVGGDARYWKEALAAALVVRALHRGLPSRAAMAGIALTASAVIAYLLAGSGVNQVAWGIKLTFMWLVVAWALDRLGLRNERSLGTIFEALAFVVGAAAVLALWQRSRGAHELMALGYPYGVRIRQANGALRAYAGFDYAAPYAYMCALATVTWLSLFLSEGKRYARSMAWVPVCGLLGLWLTLNRTALVGLTLSSIVVVVKMRRTRLVVLVIPVIVAGIVMASSSTAVGFLGQGFSFHSTSSSARVAIWKTRWADLSTFGRGPGSAGAASIKANASATPQASAASTGASGAVVDDQYLTWAYEYGLIGGGLAIGVWLLLLLGPLLDRRRTSAAVAMAAGWAAFMMVAGVSANVWEELPVNIAMVGVYVTWLATRCGDATDEHRSR